MKGGGQRKRVKKREQTRTLDGRGVKECSGVFFSCDTGTECVGRLSCVEVERRESCPE